MKKKWTVGLAIMLAGNVLLGMGAPAIGIHTPAVYAASEFGITTAPANGAKFVGTGSSLGLSFDRQVTPQSGEITITYQDSGAIFTKIAIGSSGLIGSATSYELKLGSGLSFQPYKTYTVTIPKGLFIDGSGNQSAETSWSFTTSPETNPAITVTGLSPANNARVDAGTVSQLSLSLSGNLTNGGGSVRLLSAADNSVIQEFIMAEGQNGVNVQSDGSTTTATFTLAKQLSAGSNYYVLIDAYAFKGADNRTYQGISSGTGWSFSTLGSNAISTSTYPENGASGISSTAELKLYFDRTMRPASGYITVSPGAQSDSRARWLNVNSTSVTGGGSSTITLLPATSSNPLLSGTTYTVTLPEGAFYDQDGHLFPAAGTGGYSWKFTTAAQNTLAVNALSPTDQSESVAITKQPTITFNRDVVYNSSVANAVVLYKSGGTKIAATVAAGSSAKEFIIKPTSALEANTVYYIDIAKGAFTDAADSSLVYEGLSGSKSWSFRTLVQDKTAPVISSSVMENSKTIRLKYNETLNSSIALLASSFTVTVNDETRTIESAYIEDDSVFVVLSTGVAVGQIVKISYTGGVRTIQDTSGNVAATFASRQVTNALNSSLPTPKEGRISGKTVTLTFNESLKSVSTYAYDQFIVSADGYSLGVESIRSSGKTVTLTVGSEAGDGAIVRVSYYAGSYPLQSSAGQTIADFTDYYIKNTKDTVAPVFQYATGADKTIILYYNEGLSESNLPMNSQFSVLVGGAANYVTAVAVSGSQVTLTLQSSLVNGQTVTVSYVPGTKNITDLNNNKAAYIDLQPVELTASAVSGISSATVNGSELTVNFSQNMQTSATLNTAQFVVRADGTTIAVSSYTLSGSILKLTLSTAIKTGQIVDLTYTSSSALIRDYSGNTLASFSLLPVQNLTGTSTTTTTTTTDSARPSYLTTLEATEFGTVLPLLKSDSATPGADRSVYSQSVKRYNLSEERLAASYTYLNSKGTNVLAFEVPSSELAAYVTVPLQPLLDAYNLNKNTTFVIRYGDHMYSIAMDSININGIAANLNTVSSNVSLVLRIEAMPSDSIAPFAQRLRTQGLNNVTTLVDLRVAAILTGNYTSEYALNVPAKYTVRTTSAVTTSQAAVMRLDFGYYDAAYLPTTFSRTGSYTVMSTRVDENQVVGAFTSTRSFTDMGTHWSNTLVAELAAKNIIDSSYGTQFTPEQKITRAEFAVMLSRGLGLLLDTETAQRFTDVGSTTQTGGYIGAAAKAGIITGNTDGTFRPNDYITREQMAIMMNRALEYTGNPVVLSSSVTDTLSAFKDRSSILSQSVESVAKAVKAGIIQGMTTSEFQPRGNATRAQAAVMLHRMLKLASYM